MKFCGKRSVVIMICYKKKMLLAFEQLPASPNPREMRGKNSLAGTTLFSKHSKHTVNREENIAFEAFRSQLWFPSQNTLCVSLLL